ncbi:MAG TPA: c-type cytochrome [Chitinophagales bacterium]|nr:c-type cytochrome [Chitinophagales bacterium]
MKKVITILMISSLLALVVACNSNPTKEDFSTKEETTETPAATTENGNPSYDPKRGEGKFTKVDIGATLDATMATSGKKIAGVKCTSCHKTTEEKLVGPGWKGVTTRRTPEWIMNFITNTDAMIDKDPEAQAQLEICLVRMPNQSLSDDDARHLLEFMRKNDGVK